MLSAFFFASASSPSWSGQPTDLVVHDAQALLHLRDFVLRLDQVLRVHVFLGPHVFVVLLLLLELRLDFVLLFAVLGDNVVLELELLVQLLQVLVPAVDFLDHAVLLFLQLRQARVLRFQARRQRLQVPLGLRIEFLLAQQVAHVAPVLALDFWSAHS